MNAYQPRAGSIGEKSIAYLKAHGVTQMRDLADAIDADVGAMPASLNLCIANGLIVRETVGGYDLLRLPQPEAEPAVDDIQVEMLTAAIAAAAEPAANESVAEILRAEFANGEGSLARLFDVQEEPSEASADFSIRESLQRNGSLAPAAEKRHFEFGLFSDGRFVIELADTVATLTRDETDRLYQFFRKVDAVGSLA